MHCIVYTAIVYSLANNNERRDNVVCFVWKKVFIVYIVIPLRLAKTSSPWSPREATPTSTTAVWAADILASEHRRGGDDQGMPAVHVVGITVNTLSYTAACCKMMQ